MPPSTTTSSSNKRRRTSATTSTPASTSSTPTAASHASQQSTISFNRPTKPSVIHSHPPFSKPSTKPSTATETKDVIKPPSIASVTLPSRPAEISFPEADVSDEESTDETDEQDASDEAAAAKITDKQIKAYWAGKEDARKAPRVHQAGLSVRERVCREFDFESRFGPCTGIPRLQRWKRARGLGLNPPIEVLAVLRKEMEDGAKEASGKTSKGKKSAEEKKVLGSMRGQKSVVDELIMSSRLRGGDGLQDL